jgi:tetratricopeptide (TPR) repeat protein
VTIQAVVTKKCSDNGSVLGNQNGIASAHNNIAAACLEMGNFTEAETHFTESIKLGEAMIAALSAQVDKSGHGSDDEPARAIDKMKRTVSDRKGNLVVLRLRQDDFTAAFTLLEQLLLADSQDNYVMGCIIKQGILGHYYLKQRELKSAERVFSSALEFIRSKDAALFNESWNLKEAQVAEQVQGR